MSNRPFSAQMKLSDVIYNNHNLLLLLPRFGIPTGFGERTIGQICEENGVSIDLFLYVCNVYCYEGFSAADTPLKESEMPGLIQYLRASHHYYLDERLPHISRHLNALAEKAGTPYGDSVKHFFDDYRKEVEDHFAFEEKHIFPTVLQDIRVCKQAYVGAHDNIEEKLSDLVKIIFKYVPDKLSSEEIIELTFDIFQLAEDLDRHTVLEESVFMEDHGAEHTREKSLAGLTAETADAGEALTQRETEVLVLVAKGYMSKEIADMLNISMNTVNTHRKNINAKTGIKSIAGLTVYAMLNNLM